MDKIRQTVHISTAIMDKMIEHAQQEKPVECCGVLGGNGNTISSLYPLVNDRCSPTRFFANPQDLFKAIRSMRDQCEELIGIYHSHPTSPAIPSETDKQDNFYPGTYYFIVSLAHDPPDVRCYMMNDAGDFTTIFIQ